MHEGKFICPKCRNPGLHLWMGAYVGMIYECSKCGYRGPICLEAGKKSLKKFKM